MVGKCGTAAVPLAVAARRGRPIGQRPSRLQVGIRAAGDFDTLERQQAIQVDARGQPASRDPDPNDRRTHVPAFASRPRPRQPLTRTHRMIPRSPVSPENAVLSQQHHGVSSRVYPPCQDLFQFSLESAESRHFMGYSSPRDRGLTHLPRRQKRVAGDAGTIGRRAGMTAIFPEPENASRRSDPAERCDGPSTSIRSPIESTHSGGLEASGSATGDDADRGAR